MGRYADILADIKSRMEAIAGIGKVYDYDRWNADMARFIELFAYTPTGGQKQIRGWEITRTGFTEHKAGAFFRHHKFQIKGYMGLKDESGSEKTFQAIIEAVSEKFRAADTGENDPWEFMDGDAPGNSPVQGGSIEVRMYGNVLCHHTALSLSVTERILT